MEEGKGLAKMGTRFLQVLFFVRGATSLSFYGESLHITYSFCIWVEAPNNGEKVDFFFMVKMCSSTKSIFYEGENLSSIIYWERIVLASFFTVFYCFFLLLFFWVQQVNGWIGDLRRLSKSPFGEAQAID
jgi:hypothetical protein